MTSALISPSSRRRRVRRLSFQQVAVVVGVEAGLAMLALAGMRWHVAQDPLCLAWLWSAVTLDWTAEVAVSRGRSFLEGLILGLACGPLGPIVEHLLPRKSVPTAG
jgi:hypothetical protein